MKKTQGKSKTLRRNIVLSVLSLGLVGLAFGLDPNDGMNSATADDLSPPPLIWEAQPKKERAPDNSYYNKQKANRAPAQGGQATSRRIDPSKSNAIAPEETVSGARPAVMPPHSGDQSEGISVEEYEALRAAPEDGVPGVSEGSPGEGAPDEDAADKRAPAQPAADCNYDRFVGQNVSNIDFSLFGKRPTRIIYPGQAVTMDFSADRINFEVERDGTINRVACY